MPDTKVIIPEDFTTAISEVLKTTDWTLTKNNGGGKYLPATKFVFTANINDRFSPNHVYRTQISSWEMVQFPGCCGICISYFQYIPSYVDAAKTLAVLINKLSIWIAKKWGYGLLMYAVISDSNINEVLVQNSWQEIYNFKNPSSKVPLTVSIVDLTSLTLADIKAKEEQVEKLVEVE